MTLSDELRRLRELVEKATPGPWNGDNGRVVWAMHGRSWVNAIPVAYSKWSTGAGPRGGEEDNAKAIAAFDPRVARALLDVAAEAECVAEERNAVVGGTAPPVVQYVHPSLRDALRALHEVLREGQK